jgi:hypothetical protein
MRRIQLFESYSLVSENLKYHVENNIPFLDNIFRPHSEAYLSLIKEARTLWDIGQIEVNELDHELFESTDFGLFEEFDGQLVPLDLPMENFDEVNEAEYKGKKVNLNRPMRSSGPKKYKVYVKNPKTGNVKVVHFGDVKGGLTQRVRNPKAKRSFAARHQCSKKKDKTTAGYWSCRLNRFSNLVGKGASKSGYW